MNKILRNVELLCKLSILLLILLVTEVESSSKSQLLQAIVITRHGDRTPTKVFPNTKSEWPEGLGQLTHIGMKQHYDLGQKFRKRYVEDLKFVNTTYKRDEVYVRSTPKERTLMSAHSFMLGFFPAGTGPVSIPSAIQPVPIYSVEKKSDTLLYAYKNCNRLKLLTKEVQSSDEWMEMTTKHESVLTKLSEIFGGKIGLKEVTSVLNIFNGETIHNKPRISELTHEVLATLKDVANWVFKRKFHTKDMGKLGTGTLVADIRDRFHTAKTFHEMGKQAEHRFVLYSAHDGTLLALMSALELTFLEVPHYSAHFVFELHFDEQFGYVVKIFYNSGYTNELEPVNFPNCGPICSVDQFKFLVEPSISTKWSDECSIEETQYLLLKWDVTTWALGFISGLLIMGLVSARANKLKSV